MPRKYRSNRRRWGIAILLVVLVASLSGALVWSKFVASRRAAMCAANLQQIGIATDEYAVVFDCYPQDLKAIDMFLGGLQGMILSPQEPYRDSIEIVERWSQSRKRPTAGELDDVSAFVIVCGDDPVDRESGSLLLAYQKLSRVQGRVQMVYADLSVVSVPRRDAI
ncbi:MAG: hypothetical protein ACIARR_00610, partial [Phycisphaerales bacterium JB059]